MKVELLKQARDWFASVPEDKVCMYYWGSGQNTDGKNEDHSCLTAGCFAGWCAVYEPFRALGLTMPRFSHTPIYGDAEGFAAISEFFDMGFHDTRYICLPHEYYTEAQLAEKLAGTISRLPITREMVLAHIDEVLAKHAPQV